MRGISHLLAVLIMIAIVVSVGIAVGLMSGALVQRLQPSGAAITIQSVRAQALTSDSKTILVEAVVNVNGPQSVSLTNAWLYWSTGSSATSASKSQMTPPPDKWFPPGTSMTVQIIFRIGSNPPSEYSPVRVVLEYKDTANNVYRVSGSGTLEPYNP